ncbi:MAG: prepilin-type N-terminal cleavage/methylation domain-containing protein [Candidatus Omnitrophota bacterium]
MRGFTLVEVLVVVVIFSLMVAGIFGVLNLGNVTFPVDLGKMEVHQQARLLMQWLTRDLRQATNLQIIPLTVNSDKKIFFRNSKGLEIIYYLDLEDSNEDGLINQVIRIGPVGKGSGSEERIIANNISRFKFKQEGRLLRIEVVTEQNIRNKNLSFKLIDQVYLRNE